MAHQRRARGFLRIGPLVGRTVALLWSCPACPVPPRLGVMVHATSLLVSVGTLVPWGVGVGVRVGEVWVGGVARVGQPRQIAAAGAHMGRRRGWVVRRRARDPDREAVPPVSRRLIIASRESRMGGRGREKKKEDGWPAEESEKGFGNGREGTGRSKSTVCDPGNPVCGQPPASLLISTGALFDRSPAVRES